MPEDDEDKGKPPSFNRLRYRFISEFLGGVLDEAFAAKAPPYSTILKLDKNLRDSDLRCGSIDMSATEDGTAIRKLLQFLVQPLSTTAMREIALMYLHRRYFVEALARQPREPLRSKYAMSVLAVHRSSVLLLQGILGLDRIVEEFLTRLSFIWIHALSAYVCLCAIVIKSPGSRLARSSLTEIDRIKSSFARATTYRVFHAQPTIDKLYQQAHLAMNQYRKGKWPPTKPDEEIDAGVMKLIGRAGFAPEKPQEAITPTSESDHSENHQSNGIHPDLFEYMKQFENQSEKNGGSTSTYPTQMSTLNFLPEQRIFPSLIPGFTMNNGVHGSQPPSRSTKGFDTIHYVDPHSNHSNFTHPPFHPTDWPSNHIYGGPPVGMNSTGGYAPPISSQPFLYGDPFLEQGMGPLHPGQQQPQDQVWEQFLSTLMPNESSQNPT
ncbi:hypothetical protein CPB86DRAFT_537491 [Serendipita vermifera]|nr:hypothetical protein CPB86DRAFT_537491 [Serendipita vermifera]